ncbi:ABC transporter ATP-binding protein [Limibacillus halophilus]|uniref:Branched-chain amino acid transport system ATP-binding protein n=1 Tax=Limibacillus halophilus TaxID=1579333 RepID=A0A839T0V6_9PROT|nr:ABC transporter ATP-binding protein [Limibacillus halophilus]MBB3066995.1 branched-chain amino acid transport system ATP-binding protein [Limibacillus halophilus]
MIGTATLEAGHSSVAPSAEDLLLTVEGLVAGYGPITVLHGLDLDIRRGEIHAIVGANGVGKSTLLRTVSGLLQPEAGRVIFDGEDITGMRPDGIVARGISHAPEGHRVFKGLSVEENLRLGAYRRGGDGAKNWAALDQVYNFFPKLRERRMQLAGTLSGGEQQMCAIGRALMADPKLLIIDELSLGLAPVIVEELLHILSRIHTSGGTILLVEQDVSVALGFSDRASVVQSGRVILRGEARSLLNDPGIKETYLGG